MDRLLQLQSISRLRLEPETGILVADLASAVSYPQDDYATCFGIEDGSFWFHHRNQCITAAVRRFSPAGFILDVGGGNGFVARALTDAGFETVLLEPGAVGARNARERRGLPSVVCGTLEGAAFDAGSIPAVGLFDVLEHIEDDRTFVRRLHGIVQPGGLLYLTVPSFNWLWSISDVDAFHYRRYSHSQLAAVLTPDFDVLYSTYLFQRLVPVFFLSRTVPFRLGLAKPKSAAAYEAEHAAGHRKVSSGVIRLLAHEIRAIERSDRLTVGSSLLVVARRTTK